MSKYNKEKMNSRDKAKKKIKEGWKDLVDSDKPVYFKGITDKQRSLMIKLGIKYSNKTTRKEASELISNMLESRKQS